MNAGAKKFASPSGGGEGKNQPIYDSGNVRKTLDPTFARSRSSGDSTPKQGCRWQSELPTVQLAGC